MIKKTLKIVVLLVFTMCLSAQSVQQEFFDPEEIRKPYNLKQLKTILFSDEKVFEEDPGRREQQYIETSGYRIQLISTKNLQEALEVKERADSLFRLPVYVDFESPNYKVRLGNYKDHDEAQQSQKRMQKSGFSHAWIVPSKIIIVQ
ncbi:MAG: SPOR domain-containing protein [Candidatus Marinimicrobia bacterium]|nr:SPOR domain-containing protein [Candidatus Neomarinimicrobiota bacterium]